MKSNYQQPNFYHFNEDSILLVKTVLSDYEVDNCENILDLCAGCGVVGIEYINGYQKSGSVENLSFIEKNIKFKESLVENIETLLMNKSINVDVIIEDLRQCDLNKKMDLILSNPPFYSIDSHRISENNDRRKCRSFEIGFLEDYVNFLRNNLSSKGHAFFITDKSNEKSLLELGLKKEKFIGKSTILYHVTSFE